MSYSLSLHLIDLEKARGAIGSGDERLRRMIGGRFRAALAHADEWFADEIEAGAPTRYDAVRAVIDGGPYDAAYGFQYGYAYKTICDFFGVFLDSNDFSPFRGGWLETVDEGLAKLGIGVRVTDFMYGTVPSELPRPADLPGYGEWSPEDCARTVTEWEATTAEQRDALDPEVLKAVESCVGWAREARARPGWGVAGFGS